MNILIINLTRMGDILQSGPLVWGLKHQNPRAKIFYLADINFASVLDNLPKIDHKITIDVKEILTKLIHKSDELVENFIYLKKMISCFDGLDFDLVINLTHTDESKVITWLANGKKTVGITMDDFGYRIVKHPWENYFYCSNLNRAVNRINLVDIYLRMGDITQTPKRMFFEFSPEIISDENAILAQFGLNKPYFCIQLGASVENKQYPPEKFAEIANRLYQIMGLTAVFVGTNSEMNLFSNIKSYFQCPVINLLGKTNLDQLGLILKNSRFLLTNDTGTMHIAAGVQTRIFCIALATAYSHETCAYGEGNIIFEAEIACTPCSHHVVCLNPVCKNYISPQVIAYVIENYDKIITSKQKITFAGAEKMKIFKTGFDAENYLRLFPLTPTKLNSKEVINRAYHYLWIKSLGFIDYQTVKENHDFFEYYSKIKSELNEYYIPVDAVRLKFDLNKFITDLKWLKGVAGQAQAKTIQLQNFFNNKDYNSLKNQAPELIEFDGLITNRGLSENHLRPLTFFFQFDKDNLDTNDVKILLEKTSTIYSVLEFRCDFLLKLLELF